jgi:hypothetical protein
MSTSSEPSESSTPEPARGEHAAPDHSSYLQEVFASAEALDSQERLRLAARLMESMPRKDLAALLTFGAERLRAAQGQVAKIATPHTNSQAPPQPEVDPLWPFLRERLFDPSKTSDLYSAPRRFDLATIFVVTAAYSLLLGAMSAMDFGPITKMSVGLLVTVIAASQAFFQNVANPRGVSIVSGAIAQSVLILMLGLFVRNWLEIPLIAAVILYGLLGGAIAGYLIGAMVGGVFLVADKLRVMFENRAKAKASRATMKDVD